ncbi:hypothetical protein ES703_74840 [subsurface metagenome]
MRRIIIIAFLFFMFFVSVCCESKTKARMRYEAEQQKIHEKATKEGRQFHFMRMRTSTPGRYEIFQHQQKNVFLLDNMDGRVWIIVEDKETKELVWQEVNVENREILNIEEFIK